MDLPKMAPKIYDKLDLKFNVLEDLLITKCVKLIKEEINYVKEDTLAEINVILEQDYNRNVKTLFACEFCLRMFANKSILLSHKLEHAMKDDICSADAKASSQESGRACEDGYHTPQKLSSKWKNGKPHYNCLSPNNLQAKQQTQSGKTRKITPSQLLNEAFLDEDKVYKNKSNGHLNSKNVFKSLFPEPEPLLHHMVRTKSQSDVRKLAQSTKSGQSLMAKQVKKSAKVRFRSQSVSDIHHQPRNPQNRPDSRMDPDTTVCELVNLKIQDKAQGPSNIPVVLDAKRKVTFKSCDPKSVRLGVDKLHELIHSNEQAGFNCIFLKDKINSKYERHIGFQSLDQIDPYVCKFCYRRFGLLDVFIHHANKHTA